jgi:ABC-2 type transport system permease protein
MTAAAMTLFQLRFVNKAFWRNPASAFFTFALPLMFLVIFTSLLGQGHVLIGGRLVHQSTYYVAEMGAFAVVTACYNNIAIGVSLQRDTGILKRVNGTPLPAPVYFAARVLHAMGMAVLLVAITAAFGTLAYSADIPTGWSLLRFLVILAVGAATFAALGFAVTAVIPNYDAAGPVVYATILPILFVSGVFIPIGDDTPAWITWVGRIFPVKHFADAMRAGFLRTTFHWGDVLVVAAWGVVGLLVAIRWFKWEPRT